MYLKFSMEVNLPFQPATNATYSWFAFIGDYTERAFNSFRRHIPFKGFDFVL